MDGEGEFHTLQNVHFPKSGSSDALYLRHSNNASPAGGSIMLAESEKISTNAYFNSFYVDYWRRFTRVGVLGVHVAFEGHIRISIWHVREGEGGRELVSRTAGGNGASTTDVTVWLGSSLGEPDLSDGRLFVETEALALSEIHTIAYVTNEPPLHEVSVSVGICTFNREGQLCDLLKELIGAAEQNPAVVRVHVVNQGGRFASQELADLFQDERLLLVEQANLGGCGGFNRTIYETLGSALRCTHHLLMDDDVRIDARVLETTVSFLSYAERDIVLGGHMLQTHAETTLLEAGAVFDPVWFVKPVGKGADLSEPGRLDLFNAFQPVNYNGWWFCALPTERLKVAGFSPPVFIRGDDMEYGCRMEKLGVPTVPLPGIAVWHDLNFSHASDWDQYYDIRNRLILSTLHGDVTPQPGAHFVFGYVLECLLTHRYAAARMCMAGIADFLLGPDRLFAIDPAERHRRVMALAASMPQSRLEETEAHSLEWGDRAERPDTVGANAPVYLRRLCAVLFLPHRTHDAKLYRYDDVNPLAVGNCAYVVTDARKTVFVRHVPRRASAFAVLFEAVALTLRFIMTRARANDGWSRRIGVHQSRESWELLFELRAGQ